VSKIIERLNTAKSSGIDQIRPNIITLCEDKLAQPLATLINNCIATGIFPDALKIANVIPLHKGGDKNDPNNFRPISILPTISKIIERHVANQLNTYLKETVILSEHQSGFRENHSCQNTLIILIDAWLSDLDDGYVVGTIFVDFKKEFDLVDQTILLHKLKLYHFSNLTQQFFESYLTNRLQLVWADGVSSNTCLVTSGVPQGSILGPLLFLLYVNDLPLFIKSESDMYADDVTIYSRGKEMNTIQD
jgi:hypothetical protein